MIMTVNGLAKSQLPVDSELCKVLAYLYMELTQANLSTDVHKAGDYIGTVNTQGRVTLPEAVRKALQVHPQDKVIFRITEGRVEVVGKLPTLEELAGSVNPLQPNADLEEITREAKVEHYQRRFTQKMQP